MLTVPKVTETDLIHAYDRVRAAGFRVGVSTRFTAASLCVPNTQDQLAPPGGVLAEGAVLTVSAGPCPIASPSVQRPMPEAIVPDFDGLRASEVVAWAERSGMFWAVRNAPAFAASAEPHLLDNYRVTRQSPRPGAELRPGVVESSGGQKGFRPTPITVWVELG